MELGEGGEPLEDSRFKSSRLGQLVRLAKWQMGCCVPDGQALGDWKTHQSLSLDPTLM